MHLFYWFTSEVLVFSNAKLSYRPAGWISSLPLKW